MESIKEILESWGIISPPEFFTGIGICIAVPLLIVSAAFRLFFMKLGEVEGYGWKQGVWGVLGCSACSTGLLMVFIPPIFFTPSEVPDLILGVMAVGDLLAIPGLLLLVASVLLGIRSLLHPRGNREISWGRRFVFYVPLIMLFSNIVRLYQVLGVH
jgi:hypothetical protein